MRAAENGMACCHVCHQIVSVKHIEEPVCPRCSTPVHSRTPHSIQQTWAFVISAVIMYIPANLLPMMHVVTFAGTESDTIISGVIYFFRSGSYLIAFVIFVASIIVPVTKLIILIYLLLSVQKKKTIKQKERHKLYNLTELIGKWSMVDVYVVSTMIALVHFKGLTEIKAAPGALFFLLVVILTMTAAMKFDPRLIWDGQKEI